MTHSRRRFLPVAAAVVVLAACGGGDDDAAPSPSTTTAPTTATTAVVAEAIRIGEHDALAIELLASPDWLAVDDFHLYVKGDNGTIFRLDPGTGAVLASADVGDGRCQGIGVGFDSGWGCQGSDVVRVDLDAGAVAATLPAGKTAGQGHLATGFDRVWVLQGDGDSLVAIDPATDELGDPIALPVRGTDVTVGREGIWVVSALDDAVVMVDPADGTVVHRVDGFDEPVAISALDGTVWVGDAAATHAIDETSGERRSTFTGGVGRTGALAPDTGGVWVRRGAEIRHLDGATGEETDAFTLELDGPSPGDMVAAFGALWTSASEDSTLFRIELG